MRIAFALSQGGTFDKKHFGDADTYQIYELKDGLFALAHEEANPTTSFEDSEKHGNKEKAKQIIKFLKNKQVDVLVSKQFGTNIKFIARHFIPVKISKDTPERVKESLLKHQHWIQEEIDNQPEAYKLFVLGKGVLKATIKV